MLIEVPFLEPSSLYYLFINTQSNVLHLFIPFSTKRALPKWLEDALAELLSYKSALDIDLRFMPEQHPQRPIKQERLQYILAYLNGIKQILNSRKIKAKKLSIQGMRMAKFKDQGDHIDLPEQNESQLRRFHGIQMANFAMMAKEQPFEQFGFNRVRQDYKTLAANLSQSPFKHSLSYELDPDKFGPDSIRVLFLHLPREIQVQLRCSLARSMQLTVFLDYLSLSQVEEALSILDTESDPLAWLEEARELLETEEYDPRILETETASKAELVESLEQLEKQVETDEESEEDSSQEAPIR